MITSIRTNRAILLTVILFIILNAVSCRTDSSKILQSFSCPVSCWNKITPGRTAKDEAISILNNIQSIQEGSIDFQNVMGMAGQEHVVWNFSNKDQGQYGEIYLTNGITSLLHIGLGKNTLRLDQFVQDFGEPDQYFAAAPPNQKSVVFLIYRKKGFILYHDFGNLRINQKVSFSPNDAIHGIILFDPDQLEETLLESFVFPFMKETFNNNAKNWSGYSEINFVKSW